MINENVRYNFYLTETENEDDEDDKVEDPFGIYAPPTDEDVEDEEETESNEVESTAYKIIEDDEDIDLSNKVI